ncbi:MAG: hypothetical protein H7062_13095, partial [Candidatus Saccharimonas sp.]|nr:hypothetical protein [Planctomycetaceae bacterium]
VARFVEESARREHKSASEWVQEHMASEADRAKRCVALEGTGPANAYPSDWLALFGSLADDESFVTPSRTATSRTP